MNVRQVPKLFKPGFSYHSIEPVEDHEEDSVDDQDSRRDSTDSEIELGRMASTQERTRRSSNNESGGFPVSTIRSDVSGSSEEIRPILGQQGRRR